MKQTLLSPQAAVRVSAPRCPSTPAASGTAPLRGRTADELSRNGRRSVPRCPSPHWDLLRWSDGCGRLLVWLARNGGSSGICGAVETHRHQLEDPERSQRNRLHKSSIIPIVCHYSQRRTYLLIKLAGGRGSAEAAATVAQLRLRVQDCQLEPVGTVAVRRAQRNCWDVTGRSKQTEGEKDHI